MSERERRKSLKDLKPSDFSLKDGSIRFIWAFTAELCSQSASSFSRPICRARVSRPVASALWWTARRRRCGSPGPGDVRAALPVFGRCGPARRERVVRVELVARGGERLRGRARHADPDDVAAEPLAALGERNVVGVARDDHDVGEVGQAEHVLDGVDGEADVGAVLRVGGGREQLHQVDGARHELAAVDALTGDDQSAYARVSTRVPNDAA